MDKSAGRAIIIKYIRSNMYCTKEEVVQGVSEKLSRVPAYAIIKELMKEGVVLDEKKRGNRRNHRLIINEKTPLVTVPEDLELFGTAFLALIDATLEAVLGLRKRYNDPDKVVEMNSFEAQVTLYKPLKIFSYVMNAFVIYSTIIWPSKITDEHVINELGVSVFIKMARIRSEWSLLLKKADLDLFLIKEIILGTNIEVQVDIAVFDRSILGLIDKSIDWYSVLGIRSKLENMFDTLWRLTVDLRHEMARNFPETFVMYEMQDWREALKSRRRVNRKKPRTRTVADLERMIRTKRLIMRIDQIPDFIRTSTSLSSTGQN